MKISLRDSALVGEDLEAALAAEYRQGERAVTQAMRAAQAELKTNWRGQVTSAGLGQRLANTIRGEAYPRGTDSMNAAALIWTKAPKLIAAYERGVTIRARDGFWLAIPTPAAGMRTRGRKMTPEEWQRRHGIKLRFVHTRKNQFLLVADEVRTNSKGQARRKGGKRRQDGILTGAQTVVIFILVPQARVKKRLDLMKAADALSARLPQMILANWPEV